MIETYITKTLSALNEPLVVQGKETAVEDVDGLKRIKDTPDECRPPTQQPYGEEGSDHLTSAPRQRKKSLVRGVDDKKYLSAVTSIPLYTYVLCWIFLLAFASAITIYFIEERRYEIMECFFLAIAGVTCSGLTTIDFMQLSSGSLVVLTIVLLLGSGINLSLIPVWVRLFYLKRSIPLNMRTFNLRDYERLPSFVVEYKCLQLISRIAIAYMVIMYALGTILIYVAVMVAGKDETIYDPQYTPPSFASPLGFAIFTSVSAFTNCGFSLRPTYRGNISPSILVVINFLSLSGNVFFPIFMRWIIIFLSRFSDVESSRKVCFRYILVNGRKHYSCIFTSQQTWLLFCVQLLFIFAQTLCLCVLGNEVNTSQALFMAITTRHTGFTAVDLASQNSGILVLFLAMMFLAPT